LQVAAHPVLAESLELRLFIESTSTELKEWYERGYIGEAITGASTMFESMTTTVKETADKPAVELTDQQLEEMWPSPPWGINDASTLAYLATAEEAMCKLCLCSEKIADQHDEQARALFAFANGLTEIGNAEDKTCDVRNPPRTRFTPPHLPNASTSSRIIRTCRVMQPCTDPVPPT